MKTLLGAGLAALAIAGPAFARPAFAQGIPLERQPGTTGTVIQGQSNTTGNSGDLVISRGATGADTITTDSAAGGNASLPERPIPNGSANGGGGGR